MRKTRLKVKKVVSLRTQRALTMKRIRKKKRNNGTMRRMYRS
jgi:hypothetical protein